MKYKKVNNRKNIPCDLTEPHLKRLLLLTEKFGEFIGFYDGTNFRINYATILENVTHYSELPKWPE